MQNGHKAHLQQSNVNHSAFPFPSHLLLSVRFVISSENVVFVFVVKTKKDKLTFGMRVDFLFYPGWEIIRKLLSVSLKYEEKSRGGKAEQSV